MSLRCWLVHVALAVLVITASACTQAPLKADEVEAVGEQQLKQREAEFERLSGAALVGHFTDSNKVRSELTEERYVLEKVSKVSGENWLFRARIQYGGHDITVPLTLPVRWAGDTPVICVDNIPVPGLGTFTARVVIYEDHYAGFWRGAGHGGHLFGIIERPKPE